MQLETQARTKLNEEINGTITKENELNQQLEVYKMAALKVQEGFNKSEDYHKIEQLQIELANKMKLLTSYQNQLEKTHQEKVKHFLCTTESYTGWVLYNTQWQPILSYFFIFHSYHPHHQ